MKTNIIMIRHGYSVANNAEYFTGNLDVELTETGVKQAQLCADWLADTPIDAIYASDLVRAYHTAVPIAEKHRLPIIKDKRLREIDAGEWEGVQFDELMRRYPQEFSTWRYDVGRAACNGGETVAQFAQRILHAMTEIAQANAGKTVCVVTHATPIRVISAVASGIAIEDMAKARWACNASINRFAYENGNFSVVAMDQTEHLGALCTGLPRNV